MKNRPNAHSKPTITIALIIAAITIIAMTAAGCSAQTPNAYGQKIKPEAHTQRTPHILHTQDDTISVHQRYKYGMIYLHERHAYTTGLERLAYVPGTDIALYGSESTWGISLRHNGRITRFPHWLGPCHRQIMPQLLYHDLDGSGENNLAVILHVGASTGVSVQELHVLSVDGDSYRTASLLIDGAHTWMEAPWEAHPLDDGKFEFIFAGDSYTIDLGYDGILSHVWFRDIINFWFEDTEIHVRIAMGAIYETIGSPIYFGEITAQVIFEGGGLTLRNYTFHVYE